MSRSLDHQKQTRLTSRFGAFVAERHPLALAEALAALEAAASGSIPIDESGLEALREAFRRELSDRLRWPPTGTLAETTPGVAASVRLEQARGEVLDGCDGFLRRAAIEASLTADERREILRGMILTRAIDNRLKTLFTSSEVRYGGDAVSGQGLPIARPGGHLCGGRSGCAAAPAFRSADGRWSGDVIAPMIRDLGVALAMRCDAGHGAHGAQCADGQGGSAVSTARTCTSAISGGAFFRRPRRSASPASTVAGMALAFCARRLESRSRLVHRRRRVIARRVARGHQHLCGARRLPAVFCVQNNQTALSTPVSRSVRRSRVCRQGRWLRRCPGITIDGTESRCHRRGVRLGGRAGARRARARR